MTDVPETSTGGLLSLREARQANTSHSEHNEMLFSRGVVQKSNLVERRENLYNNSHNVSIAARHIASGSSTSINTLSTLFSNKLRKIKEKDEVTAEADSSTEEDFGDNTVASLPLELLALILSYADAKTVVRCSEVCSTLYSLAHDDSLWKRLYCRDFSSSFNHLGLVLPSRNEQQLFPNTLSRNNQSSWRDLYAKQYLLCKHGIYKEKCVVHCDLGVAYEVVNFHSETNILICRSEVFKNLHIFDVGTPENQNQPTRTRCLQILGGGKHLPIISAASNGYYVAGGSYGVVCVWIPETGERVATLQGHTENVISLRFCYNKLASGSNDGSVRIWSLYDWSCMYTLREDHLYPIKLNTNLAGDLLVCASLDFTCRVWDLKEMRSIHVVDEAEDVWIAQVEVTQSSIVILYFLDKKVTVWNVRTGESMMLHHPRSVRCIAATDSGSYLLTGGYDGCLRFWDLPTGRRLRTIREAHGKKSIDFIKCDEWKAVTASASGLSTIIKIWDIRAASCVQIVKSSTPLELGMFTRTDVGVVSDLFFGSNVIVTVSNEEATMRMFSLDVPHEKRGLIQRQLASCTSLGKAIEEEKPVADNSQQHRAPESNYCLMEPKPASRRASKKQKKTCIIS
eukprot:TRINITY_DN270_c0_g1_i2.p1 TRINITY_DN270_c0_g1~~TRINITY_DN270_c0_g1_i2.p1  ORF type:complete len:625 (+),score=131.51 TRINITY_DN270_c0_g1_i2:474-2348(+)